MRGLWIGAAMVGALVGGYLLFRDKREHWTCRAGQDCTWFKASGSWHVRDADALYIYDAGPDNIADLQIIQKEEDYFVYKLKPTTTAGLEWL